MRQQRRRRWQKDRQQEAVRRHRHARPAAGGPGLRRQHPRPPGTRCTLLGRHLAYVGPTCRPRYLFADGGFAGQLVGGAHRLLPTIVEVVRKAAGQRDYIVIGIVIGPPVGRGADLRLAYRPPPLAYDDEWLTTHTEAVIRR